MECTHGPPRAVALADGCPAIINARSGWDPRFRHGCMYAARKGMEKGRGEAAGGMAWQAALCEQGVWDGKSPFNSGYICIFAQRCAGRLGVGHNMTGCVLCTRSRRTGAQVLAGRILPVTHRPTDFLLFSGRWVASGLPMRINSNQGYGNNSPSSTAHAGRALGPNVIRTALKAGKETPCPIALQNPDACRKNGIFVFSPRRRCTAHLRGGRAR